MPNHVTNILTVNGINDEAIIDSLFNEENEIDFNTFAPMPKELLRVMSPVRIVTEEARNVEIAEYELRVLNCEPTFIGESFSITQEMSDDYINRFGANNWYDWAMANWGTKWGGYDAERVNPDTVKFLTAWSTPFKAIEKLSEKYPDHEFTVRFADEDFGSNVGTYTIINGEVVDSYFPDSGSDDAYAMAVDILGYDPREDEEEDCEEEDNV
jgi:hypothetical protein